MCHNAEWHKEFLLYLRLDDGDVVAKRCTRNRKSVRVICMSRRVVELFHELVVDIGELVCEL